MKQIILTRQELFNEVWSTPLLKLANKYAISDVGLRKLCIKQKIPLPKAGHWSKAKFGKPQNSLNFLLQQGLQMKLKSI